MKKRGWFVCVHDSARSQMAEAFLKQFCSDKFEAHPATLEPGKSNPVILEIMQRLDVDISSHQTKGAFHLYKSTQASAYFITVCDQASAEYYPTFTVRIKRLSWSFPDPVSMLGTHEEKLTGTSKVCDALKVKIAVGARKCVAGQSNFIQAQLIKTPR
jgi:arsenate reductase